jgi:hypothetical protein
LLKKTIEMNKLLFESMIILLSYDFFISESIMSPLHVETLTTLHYMLDDFNWIQYQIISKSKSICNNQNQNEHVPIIKWE